MVVVVGEAANKSIKKLFITFPSLPSKKRVKSKERKKKKNSFRWYERNILIIHLFPRKNTTKTTDDDDGMEWKEERVSERRGRERHRRRKRQQKRVKWRQ
jgi:hypothetical protein